MLKFEKVLIARVTQYRPARAWWGDVYNPAHSKAVLNCSGNTNRAMPSRTTQWKSAIRLIKNVCVCKDDFFFYQNIWFSAPEWLPPRGLWADWTGHRSKSQQLYPVTLSDYCKEPRPAHLLQDAASPTHINKSACKHCVCFKSNY